MRKLATIQKISEIKPIKDADRIVAYRVNGWWIVDQKDKYKVGDFVIYCEIDSWIPHEIAPFLSKGKEPQEFNGVKGEKLRTIRLKKQISQGLLLPLVLENFTIDVSEAEGTDLSEILNIQKWEKPVPPQLAGTMRGNFPSKIPKTDQERCLSGDTPIQMQNGVCLIENIKVGDFVLSYNHETNIEEYKKVSSVLKRTKKKTGWFLIKTKSGRAIKATHNHKIWLEDIQCYRNVSDLSVGNKIKIYHKD